ncbi:AP-4 complex subunit epsilon [Thelohanellus kitauei]|uniref:AP-4 complex subunit epsilon n=1 Tax=Thelohanellus kitauei TaxID=669202 RepID=A0A0C2N6J8_THEKT|nr:AP-4 complex subunit epsilon [Thelohanellus kitauei]
MKPNDSLFSMSNNAQDIGNQKRKLIDETLVKIKSDLFSGYPVNVRKAVLKLIHAYLCDVDISWAMVSMINLSANPKVKNKMVGYLGVSLAIHQNNKLKTLIANTINKDLNCVDIITKIVALDVLPYLIDEHLGPFIFPLVTGFVMLFLIRFLHPMWPFVKEFLSFILHVSNMLVFTIKVSASN